MDYEQTLSYLQGLLGRQVSVHLRPAASTHNVAHMRGILDRATDYAQHLDEAVGERYKEQLGFEADHMHFTFGDQDAGFFVDRQSFVESEFEQPPQGEGLRIILEDLALVIDDEDEG